MRLRYRATLSLATFAGLLLGASGDVHGRTPRPSHARSSVKDPQDTDSKLDLVVASLKGLGDGRAKLTIRTAERWGCDYLRNEPLGGYEDGDGAFLYWSFDRNNDGSFERSGHFRCRGDGLALVLTSGESFQARRSNSRSVSVKLPLDRLGLDRRALHLVAQSMVNGYWNGHVFLEESDGVAVLEP